MPAVEVLVAFYIMRQLLLLLVLIQLLLEVEVEVGQQAILQGMERVVGIQQ
jgi:hypothetical protein